MLEWAANISTDIETKSTNSVVFWEVKLLVEMQAKMFSGVMNYNLTLKNHIVKMQRTKTQILLLF